VCYGDSNTWGQKPYVWERLDDGVSWTSQLQALLGSDYAVIQEGLSARVAGNFEQDATLNGQAHFGATLLSARPVAAVVVALGINDLKPAYGRTAQQVSDDLMWYVDETRRLSQSAGDSIPPVVIVLPANLADSEEFRAFHAPRKALVEAMMARYPKCIALEGLQMSEDGIHFSPDAHTAVAALIYETIKELV
jgi:lysophospholipase L1-like esterase